GLDPKDPNGKDDVTTVNQLHLPAGRPVIVRLRSKDVIHSFMLNEFRVKQDAIPGLSIPLWFIPTLTTAGVREKTGDPKYDYEIACAQLCGIGHSKMRGFVTVHPAAEFDTWLKGESAKAAANSGGDKFWRWGDSLGEPLSPPEHARPLRPPHLPDPPASVRRLLPG